MPKDNDRSYEKIVLVGFGFSTLASLLFEIIWSRELTYIFGSSVYAISTVLTSFMTGLALGSFLFGRLADRSTNPMRLFAFLQFGISVYGALTIVAFEVLHRPYLFLHQLFGNSFFFIYAEFFISFAVLLLPATLIGGSFPVVGRIMANRPSDVARKIGDVYSFDSLGAAIGSFAAGVFLVPLLGHSGVILMASAICLVVGLVALFHSPGFKVSAVKTGSVRAKLTRFDKIILLSFYLSGYAALTYEIVWTRLLSLVFGTGTYAFSTMLTAFFLGLMLGSYLMGRVVDRIKSPALFLALLEFGIGISGLIVLPLFTKLDMPYLALRKVVTNPYLIIASWVAIPFFLLIPTAMMGATLPLVSKLLSREKGRIGSDLGMIYSANTIGGIFGAWWTGFILIPYLGIEKATVLAVISNIGASLLIFNTDNFIRSRSIDTKSYSSSGIRRVFYAGVAVTLSMSIFFSVYTMDSTSAGIYYIAKTIPVDVWKAVKENQVEVFDKETLYGYVRVHDLWGSRYFIINGKVEASNMINDLSTQYLLAYLPMIIHDNPRKVLNIGMGTGITFSRVGVFDVDEMTTVEINPMVVEVASKYFSEDNLGITKDKRANVVIEDARNFLGTVRGTYDVVISDPQDVWNSGSSALFTREYYSLIRGRLNEGGVFMQYITSSDYGPEDFKILLNTIHQAFPYVSVWESSNTLLVIASTKPAVLDYARIKGALNNPQFSHDMRLISGGKDPIDYLARSQVMNEEEVKSFIAGARVNTDNRPILEYSTNMNLLLFEEDPAYNAVLEFKRARGEEAGIIPSVVNHLQRSDGRIAADFMGIEAELSPEWRNTFSGYVFNYIGNPYSRFPPKHSKLGTKNAQFENDDAKLEFKVIPIETLIGNAKGEIVGLLNSEIENLVKQILAEKRESIDFVRSLEVEGDEGYFISAFSESTESETLIFYCDKRGEVYLITLRYAANSMEHDDVLGAIKHTH